VDTSVDDGLERKVIDIIAQKRKLSPDAVSLDSTFAELGIDSLEGIELVFTFEDTFKINVPDQVAREMKTVRQVVESLRAGLAQRGQEQAPPVQADN
jgi:acyl carrier protein